MMLIVSVVVGACLLAAVGLPRRSAPHEADVAWLVGPQLCDPSMPWRGEAMAVCRRYLTRHIRHRQAGGAFGAVFAIIVGVRMYGVVSVGIGRGSPLADVLFCGLTGVTVGSLSAETFRLGPSGDQRSVASLAAREPGAGATRVAAARGVGLASFGVGLVAGVTGHGWLSLLTSLILAVPLVVAEAVRSAIASRRRQVMSDQARLLDTRLRTFAASSVSFLHLAIATLMLGWAMSKVDGLTGGSAAIQFMIVIGCLCAAVGMLVRAAPRRPRGVADHVADQQRSMSPASVPPA